VRLAVAIVLALAIALLCVAGGGVGSASVTAAAAAGAPASAKQAAGCATARATAARRNVAKPRARLGRTSQRGRTARRSRGAGRSRGARRAAGLLRMSRKTQRSCAGFGLAQRAPAEASAPPRAPDPVAPGADPSDPSDRSAPTPSAPAPGSAPAAPVVSTLGASAYDIDGFVLRLTRTSVPAGDLTVFFRNLDVSDHNLWIEGPGGDVLERISDTVGENGGGSHTLAVTAGTWRLFCALPEHGAMTRTLTVT
jgi:plastocyanin